MNFFGGTFFAGGKRVEFGESEFLVFAAVGTEPRVDEVEFVLFVVKAHERAIGGEVEVESAFGTGFADAFADSVVGLALDLFSELFEFSFGERSEGRLEA